MRKYRRDGTKIIPRRKSVAPKYFRPGDKKKVLDYLKALKGFDARRDLAIFRVGFMAGLRADELFSMTVEDVLPERKTIPVMGKGDVYREVPISAELRKEMDEYLKAKEQVGESLEPGAPLWCSSGGKALAYRSVQAVIERRCIQAGLIDNEDGRERVRYSTHSLRHTFAIEWLTKHGSMGLSEAYTKLALIMGHEDVRTTQKYTRFDVTEMEIEKEDAA
ncbi:MAG: tyrosine-type recombinase/integrase [Nitrospirota bacterium]